MNRYLQDCPGLIVTRLVFTPNLIRVPFDLIHYLAHPQSSPVGLTRGSILFAQDFLRRGWIAGSSPARTTEIVAPLVCINSTGSRFSFRLPKLQSAAI